MLEVRGTPGRGDVFKVLRHCGAEGGITAVTPGFVVEDYYCVTYSKFLKLPVPLFPHLY